MVSYAERPITQVNTRHLQVHEVTSELIFQQADLLLADASALDRIDLDRFNAFLELLPQVFLDRYYYKTFTARFGRAVMKMKYKLTPQGGFLSRAALAEVASSAASEKASEADRARLATWLYYQSYPASRFEEIAGWLILMALELRIRSREGVTLSRVLPCDWGISLTPLSTYRKRQVVAEIDALRTFVFADPERLRDLWNASSGADAPYPFGAWTERFDRAARQAA